MTQMPPIKRGGSDFREFKIFIFRLDYCLPLAAVLKYIQIIRELLDAKGSRIFCNTIISKS